MTIRWTSASVLLVKDWLPLHTLEALHEPLSPAKPRLHHLTLFAAGLTLLSGLLFVSSHGIIRHIGGLAGPCTHLKLRSFQTYFQLCFTFLCFFGGVLVF